MKNILCLGDSITDGFTTEGGYRNTLWRLVEKNGLQNNVKFMGTKHSGSGSQNAHEGHPGFAVFEIPPEDDCEGKGRSGIYETVYKPVSEMQLDICLLQAGTNDVLSLYKLNEAEKRLEKLVNHVRESLNENGKIYLAAIPYIQAGVPFDNTGKTQQELYDIIDRYNNGVKNIISRYDNVYFANINGVLKFEDLTDGVHPSDDGYRKMGEFWFDTIKDDIRG